MLMLTLAAAVAGCGGPSASAESPLTPAEFVEIVVEIREAERDVAAEDSAAQLFDDRMREILDRHGRTQAELRSFLTANAGNLALLEQVWDTINARLTFTPPGLDADDEEEKDIAPEEIGDEFGDELGEEEGGADPPGPPRRVVPLPRDGEPLPVIR